jgi:hypothetical protein
MIFGQTLAAISPWNRSPCYEGTGAMRGFTSKRKRHFHRELHIDSPRTFSSRAIDFVAVEIS